MEVPPPGIHRVAGDSAVRHTMLARRAGAPIMAGERSRCIAEACPRRPPPWLGKGDGSLFIDSQGAWSETESGKRERRGKGDSMPRRARSIQGGYVYHVRKRPIARAALFLKEADYVAFERILDEAFRRVPLRILG